MQPVPFATHTHILTHTHTHTACLPAHNTVEHQCHCFLPPQHPATQAPQNHPLREIIRTPPQHQAKPRIRHWSLAPSHFFSVPVSVPACLPPFLLSLPPLSSLSPLATKMARIPVQRKSPPSSSAQMVAAASISFFLTLLTLLTCLLCYTILSFFFFFFLPLD